MVDLNSLWSQPLPRALLGCPLPAPPINSHSTPSTPSRVPNTPINLPQIHAIHLPLRNLTHNPRRPARHNTKTRNHHIRRHDRPIQNSNIVFDNRELADDHVGPDVDVRTDERGFDDGGGAYEDVVGDFEGVVGELSVRAPKSAL